MEYHGSVYLNRELSFTEAKKLTEMFEQEQNRMGLMIGVDGRSIHWDGSRNIKELEQPLAVVMAILDENKIKGIGIIKAIEDEVEKYYIVVIKNMVKVFSEGKIKTITI